MPHFPQKPALWSIPLMVFSIIVSFWYFDGLAAIAVMVVALELIALTPIMVIKLVYYILKKYDLEKAFNFLEWVLNNEYLLLHERKQELQSMKQ